MNAGAKEFVPIVLVPLDAGDEEAPVSINAEAKEFVPAPPGLGPSLPFLSAEATEFVPNQSRNMYCPINAKRFYDDDDNSSDDGTESTASDFSGRVLVAPGLSACFVPEGKPEQWSTLSLHCAQALTGLDSDSDSWCDDETDDYASSAQVQNEWAAVSARCAQAVEQVNHQHPWHMKKAAKAKVTDDTRRELVLDALAKLDGRASVPLPPGLAPPGLAPPGLA
jgi:hypothetical protein